MVVSVAVGQGYVDCDCGFRNLVIPMIINQR